MNPVDVPILVIIFNRSDTVNQLWDALRKVGPRKIYVAGDGARPVKPGEKEKVAAARASVQSVDWECKIETLFQEANLGCGIGPYSAIDWFFSKEEEGIILEDDCIPHPDFFAYCSALLERYRDDERIMTICGDRSPFGEVQIPGNYSYSFSRYPLIWGWASWRRAWKSMDFEVKSWSEVISSGLMRSVFRDEDDYYWFWGQFERAYTGESKGNWDIQWAYNCLFNHGLSTIPEVNLISNVGFGADATSCGDINNPRASVPTKSIDFPLRHPSLVVSSPVADDIIEQKAIGVGTRSRWRRLAKRIKLDVQRLAGKDVADYDFRP